MFGGGIYLKNNAKLETGITCSSAIGGASNFAIGCKYALDKDASVRAKVDTNSQVSKWIYLYLYPGFFSNLSSKCHFRCKHQEDKKFKSRSFILSMFVTFTIVLTFHYVCILYNLVLEFD